MSIRAVFDHYIIGGDEMPAKLFDSQSNSSKLWIMEEVCWEDRQAKEEKKKSRKKEEGQKEK